MLKINKYTIFSNILITISTSLLVLSILSTIVIAYTIHLSFSFTKEGFELLLNIYKTPINFITASLATFVIWLTLERMKQSDKQLALYSENNRFNNYFKHREEFYKYLNNTKSVLDCSNIDESTIRKSANELYSMFYNENYQNFTPELNENGKSIIKKMKNELSNSSFNALKFKFLEIDQNELESFTFHLELSNNSLITSLYLDRVERETLYKYFSSKRYKKNEHENLIRKYYDMLMLHYIVRLIEDVADFVNHPSIDTRTRFNYIFPILFDEINIFESNYKIKILMAKKY